MKKKLLFEDCCVITGKKVKWYSEKIRNLAERWTRVIENNGLYFEE
jgi:hypothetical protein